MPFDFPHSKTGKQLFNLPLIVQKRRPLSAVAPKGSNCRAKDRIIVELLSERIFASLLIKGPEHLLRKLIRRGGHAEAIVAGDALPRTVEQSLFDQLNIYPHLMVRCAAVIHRQVVLVRPVIAVRDVHVTGLAPLQRQVVLVNPVIPV